MRIGFILSFLAVAFNFALAVPGGPMAAVKPVGMMKRQPGVKRDANLAEQEGESSPPSLSPAPSPTHVGIAQRCLTPPPFAQHAFKPVLTTLTAPALEKREIVFNALELVAAALFDDLPHHRRQSVISLLSAMLVDEDDQMDMEAAAAASSTLLPASREEMAVAASTSPSAMPTSQIAESGESYRSTICSLQWSGADALRSCLSHHHRQGGKENVIT